MVARDLLESGSYRNFLSLQPSRGREIVWVILVPPEEAGQDIYIYIYIVVPCFMVFKMGGFFFLVSLLFCGFLCWLSSVAVALSSECY
jgi:hypothetical protein